MLLIYNIIKATIFKTKEVHLQINLKNSKQIKSAKRKEQSTFLKCFSQSHLYNSLSRTASVENFSHKLSSLALQVVGK